jgi:hypothetical protein
MSLAVDAARPLPMRPSPCPFGRGTRNFTPPYLTDRGFGRSLSLSLSPRGESRSEGIYCDSSHADTPRPLLVIEPVVKGAYQGSNPGDGMTERAENPVGVADRNVER